MVPDYQSLMRPLLEIASKGETHIGDAVDTLAANLGLEEEERAQLLPSGRQTRFDNRVRWAKTYLKQAGLISYPRRGYFVITERGQNALEDGAEINNAYLQRFEDFLDFKDRTSSNSESIKSTDFDVGNADTPHEVVRRAYDEINRSLAAELLDKVRTSSPTFFETLIVNLLLAMGYGGSSEEAGRALGRSGDSGVDGVIDQDPLGVDQIFVQAKRYGDGNNVGAGDVSPVWSLI